jgi:hypothetical protein|nr:MAG TPA: terminase small subunit [Caudoviricetes sp.]
MLNTPDYLPDGLRAAFSRYVNLLGAAVSPGDEDTVAKLVLAENEFLRITNHVTRSINEGEASEAATWIGAQDKLTKQILVLRDCLGLTPQSRRSRGLPAPKG